MANIKDIHGNLLSLSASDILIPSLGVSLADAIAQRLLPVPDNVTEQVEGLESKVAHAVCTISSVTVDVATDDTGTTHAEGAYQDGVLAITLYNVKGDKGDALTFEDLTDEQKAELKGEKMTFADLTEEDKNELRGAEGKGGKSAYELAVDNGFVGTVAEWLASNKGERGEKGNDGKDGSIENLAQTINANDTTHAPSSKAVADYVAAHAGQGGGDSIEAGANITIETTQDGKKRISATLAGGAAQAASEVSFNNADGTQTNLQDKIWGIENHVEMIDYGNCAPLSVMDNTILLYNDTPEKNYLGVLMNRASFSQYREYVFDFNNPKYVGKIVKLSYGGRNALTYGFAAVKNVSQIPTSANTHSGEMWQDNYIYGKIANSTTTKYKETYVITEPCYICLLENKDIENSVSCILVDNVILSGIDHVDNMVKARTNPIEVIKETVGMCGIFHRIAFIGDSLCSGETYGFDNGTYGGIDIYAYSWGMQMCRILGVEGYCYSNGGQFAKGWVESTVGYVHNDTINGIQNIGGGNWSAMRADHENGKNYDCFIIALGHNDTKYIYECGTPDNEAYAHHLGTLEDIGEYDSVNDSDTNAKTFVGYYAGIIQRCKSIQPQAKIFLVTDPKPTYKPTMDLVREIATQFSNVFVIDLANYAVDFTTNDFKSRYYLGGHMSACGYLYMSYVFLTYIDWIIRSNFDKFRDTALVGLGWTETSQGSSGEEGDGEIV